MSQHGTSILFGLREYGFGRWCVTPASGGSCTFCPTTRARRRARYAGVLWRTVRQRRTTRPRDLPQGEEPLVVRLHKRQSSCREKPCPRKAFTEQIAELPAGARVTGRLRRHVAGRVADGLAVSVAGKA